MEHATKSAFDQQRGRPHTERTPAASVAAAFVDNRPEVIAQRELVDAISHSPRMVAQRNLAEAMHQSSHVTSLRALSAAFNNSPRVVAQRQQFGGMFGEPAQLGRGLEGEGLLQGRFEAVQREVPEDEELLQDKLARIQRQGGPEEDELLPSQFKPIQRLGPPKEDELLQSKFAPTQAPSALAQLQREALPPTNDTGLPDNLKTGIESLSGMSLDKVKVHYNSTQPAQLNALAYAQGSEIHVARGQEQYLPHEAWHVVQQAQGRVEPTMQTQDGVPVNEHQSLEREADVMAERVLDVRPSSQQSRSNSKSISISSRRTTPAVQRAGEETAQQMKAEPAPVHRRGEQGEWPVHGGFRVAQRQSARATVQLMRVDFKELREGEREPSEGRVTQVLIRRQIGPDKNKNHWWIFFEVEQDYWMQVDLTEQTYRILMGAAIIPKNPTGPYTNQNYEGRDITKSRVLNAVMTAAMTKPQYKNWGNEDERYNCQHFVWALIAELNLTPLLGTLKTFRP